MIFIIYAALVSIVLGIVAFIITLNNKKHTIHSLQQNIITLEQIREKLDSQLNNVFEEKGHMQSKIEVLIAGNAGHESKISSLTEYINKADKELSTHKSSYKETQEELYQVKKELELKIQEMCEFEKRVKDWESSRQEAITQAKAAIFETASKLSEDLIAKHKNETKESEEKLSGTTKKLQEQFEKIVDNVAILNNDVKASKDTVDHVKKALLSPAGAGSLAEITLENILKSSGLEHNRDFIMQYSFDIKSESKRLRPDAVLFLPANNLMIIDSKASKYFTEITQAETKESEKEINNKLKLTMRNHLRILCAKDYQDSLREFLREKQINHISSIMFLPSETAIEKLSQIDKNFMHDAWEKDIFPVGPSGLINILAYTKFQIAVTKQTENQILITEEIRKLLSSLASLYDHAKKLGNSLYNASNHFDKFAGSFNANLLPKARNLERLGIHLQKNKSLPSSIDRFTVLTSNKVELIEVDQTENLTKNEEPNKLAKIDG
jgi:DNA recombination protein RmuC